MQNLRRLPLEGTANTRDLGGYPCPSGATAWRAFLRSDGPHCLTDGDIAYLKDYGITDSIDLRSANECEREPSRLCGVDGMQYHKVPMLDNLMSASSPAEFPDTLHGMYTSMLQEARWGFGQVFRIIANAKGGVLFHCAVGKDRTGITAMLLLLLAGVGDADIIADYTLTEIYLAEMIKANMPKLEAAGVPLSMMRSEAGNMEIALAYLREEFGSAEEYLHICGVTDEELAAVRRKITG